MRVFALTRLRRGVSPATAGLFVSVIDGGPEVSAERVFGIRQIIFSRLAEQTCIAWQDNGDNDADKYQINSHLECLNLAAVSLIAEMFPVPAVARVPRAK
jgi:hypothetical protein